MTASLNSALKKLKKKNYSTFYLDLQPALYERIILGTRTDIWTDTEPSIGYETSLSMALIIIPNSTVCLPSVPVTSNISAQSSLLKQIMNSVRKCNNSAASCSNKARTVFTRRQCRTFTGPRHKAFVNTKIMVFRRRFPCKTINAVFCHHWRQQNSLVKQVCNLEPKF